MVLEQVFELAEAARDPRGQLEHPSQVLVLVVVQQVLELGVEDLQVLLDEDAVACLEQAIQGGLVQVQLDPALLLLEPRLGLLHVLGHRVLL